MSVTGMVFLMYPDAGYIDPDRHFATQVGGKIKFLFDRVDDGRQLFCGDLVECEIENSKHGPSRGVGPHLIPRTRWSGTDSARHRRRGRDRVHPEEHHRQLSPNR